MLSKTIEKIKSIFMSDKQRQERDLRSLLRENLNFLAVDVFYIDDPKLGVEPEKLPEYYKKFFDICRDRDVMERIKYLINKQARLTLENAKNGQVDNLGGVNLNGMATIKDDFVGLANSYLKSNPNVSEDEKKSFETLGKYKVI